MNYQNFSFEEIDSVYKVEETTEFDILFQAKANQIRILRDRGFDVSKNLDKFEYSNYQEYRKKRDACLRRLVRRSENPRKSFSESYTNKKTGKKTYVAFVSESRDSKAIKIKTIEIVIATSQKESCDSLFLIANLKVNKEAIRSFEEIQIPYEIYLEKNIVLNRLDHVMNSKVRVVSEEEKKEFFNELEVGASAIAKYKSFNYSEASQSEPIIQHFLYPRGTLFKIIRENNYTNNVTELSFYARIVD